MSWHVPGDTLTRYAAHPEGLDDVTASSVEQHLIACADCRAAVATSADPVVVDASWAAIAAAIDQPAPTVAERALARLGVPADMSRLVAATPGLRAAWVAAVALLGVAAVLVARDTGSDTAFLVLAPLVPLAGVALAFVPIADPGGEAGVATPLHGPGLALRRTVAVLVPTVAILTLAGLLLPGLAGWSVVWILPGLALAATSLALSTYLRVTVAVATTAVVWVAALSSSRLASRRVPLADLFVFEPAGQVACLLALAGASLVVAARRDRFATMEVTW
jgi:hypothetical protein